MTLKLSYTQKNALVHLSNKWKEMGGLRQTFEVLRSHGLAERKIEEGKNKDGTFWRRVYWRKKLVASL